MRDHRREGPPAELVAPPVAVPVRGIVAVTDQQRQFREQRDGFETEAGRLKTQLDELKRSNDTMQGNLAKIQATLNDYNDSIKQLGEQKDAAIQRANEAERARDDARREMDAAVLAKNDAELSADLSLVEALMRRALELDESYGGGALHEFFVAYEGGRSSLGGSMDSAQQHFERALALAQGRRASPLVGYAETVAVGRQDRAEFEKLLQQALAVDRRQLAPPASPR